MLYCGIPSVNLKHYLIQTLESIRTSSGIKILLVDNMSTDGTREWIQQSGHEHILNPSNYGVARAWNQIIYWGMSHDDCDIIYILNNDIVLHPEAMDLMTESVMVGGKEVISGVNVGSSPSMLDGMRPESRYSPSINFCCFGLTPKTVKRVGFFDEGFKQAYFEDNDYHCRMNLEGIDGSCDMWAQFSHYGSRTIKEGGVTNHADHFKQNKEYFRKKWGFVP